MNIDKNKVIQIAGIAGTVLSVTATLLSNWSDKQQQDKLIEEKVMKALEEKLSNK